MEVILREDIDNLGKRGDVVDVAGGYARNYLLRRRLAMPATQGNLKTFELQKEALALREQKNKGDAEVVAVELEKWEGVISRKAGESGALFGSVTSANIAALFTAKGIVIDRRKLQLREPLKALGHYRIPIRLHREVTVEFPLRVVGETQRENEGLRERPVESPVEAPVNTQAELPPETAAEDPPRPEIAAQKPPRKKKERKAEGDSADD
ncbi:MAG: 50S ribosomal protein L9 [Acidobacteria bacterium]|nr:50S ribosomal protein L9 [Acidobacteriota bacterium]